MTKWCSDEEMQARARRNGVRGRKVLECLPKLNEYQTCLYVGANAKRFQLYGMFQREGLYVLEVWPEYCRQVRESLERPVAGVFEGDIRSALDIPDLMELAPFDIVCWWHGPEHVSTRDLIDLLRFWKGDMHALWSRAILLGCPWGVREQGPKDGNEHQVHVSTLYPIFFSAGGFEVATVGKADGGGNSLIIAFRTKEDEP